MLMRNYKSSLPGLIFQWPGSPLVASCQYCLQNSQTRRSGWRNISARLLLLLSTGLFCRVASFIMLTLHSVPCTKHIKKVWFGAGTGTHWKKREICVSEHESVRMIDLQSVRLGRSGLLNEIINLGYSWDQGYS